MWIDPADFKRQPWKNGKGETLELFRISDPQNPDQFLFRLSMAKIDTSGPFSLFPYIDRQLVLIEGQTLHLQRENGEKLQLKKYDCVSFPGEDKIQSFITVPCQDFNVMTKRGWKRANVKVLYLPKRGTLKLSENTFLYQLSGDLKYQEITKPVKTLWIVSSDIEIESLSDSISILIQLT
jgi:environmental stress-induced protein Ves